MYAGSGDFDSAFNMLLTFHLAEIEFLFGGSDLGPTVGGTHQLQRDISPQKMHHLRN